MISRRLFRAVKADRILLEYDNARSGSFEPLRDIPEDKFVVLGLITTKKADLEPSGGLRRRIKDAGRFIPPDRLALSPQCGFASSIIGNNISHEDQRRKLELVVKTARAVWG